MTLAKKILRKEWVHNIGAILMAAVIILSAYYAVRPSYTVYSSACSDFDGNQVTCSATTGCTWDSTSCSVYDGDQTSCGNTSGCTWNGGDCSIIGDEPTCTNFGCNLNYSYCSWNGSSCDGGTSPCSSIEDENTCNSSQYYSGCSGTYTAFCSGTNYPGTCSGTYDLVPPTLSSATVINTTLTLTYDDTLNAGSVPSTSSFAVTVGGVSAPLTSVSVSGSSVTITLTNNVGYGSTVVLSYTPGASPIEDIYLNNAASLSNQSVTNNTQNIPTISITAPTAGQSIYDSSVSFTATSSANGGASLEGVKFYIDSTLIGSEDTSSPYAVTLDSTAYSEGSHTLYAVARNSIAGQATSSVDIY